MGASQFGRCDVECVIAEKAKGPLPLDHIISVKGSLLESKMFARCFPSSICATWRGMYACLGLGISIGKVLIDLSLLEDFVPLLLSR